MVMGGSGVGHAMKLNEKVSQNNKLETSVMCRAAGCFDLKMQKIDSYKEFIDGIDFWHEPCVWTKRIGVAIDPNKELMWDVTNTSRARYTFRPNS